jgi:exopolysaccharide biosynthesis polyprenyl glycosylphosphotransferase
MYVVGTRDVKAVVVRSESMTLELAGVLTRLRFNGIQVYSLLDFCMRASEELPLEILNEFWLCVADGFDLLQARLFRRVKRLTDILLASVGLLAALPFLLLTAIAIRLDSAGPVLFRQRRVGWMGRPFELLKFRSMQVGAEKDGAARWAAPEDPRVTAVGRVLRKIHFDELPQMINILRGQMSFVGPRPERPEFVGPLSESINFYHLRHYVLPGVTGWAQVNYPYGASLEDARRKLQYDLYYVCNASPLLDLRTMLRTARVVLFQQGSR